MVLMMKDCAGKYSLKEGSRFIGFLYLLASVIAAGWCLITVFGMEKASNEAFMQINDELTPEGKRAVHMIFNVFRAMFYSFVAFSVVRFFSSILLIEGAKKCKPKLLLPFVIEASLLQPFGVLLLFAVAVLSFMAGLNQFGVLMLFILIVNTVVVVYSILVVYSLYRKLMAEAASSDQNMAL